MDQCPICRSRRVHHSRFRSAFERFRAWMTGLVAYRCHNCNWRGWAPERGQRPHNRSDEDGPVVLRRTGSVTDEAFDALEGERRRR